MAYDKHTWTCDEPITVERLNHIEDGIANAGGDCGFQCEEDVTLLTEETVTTTEQGGYNFAQLSYSQFINAETIRVTFDGVEYDCPRIVLSSDQNFYGGVGSTTPVPTPDFSQYPFSISSYSGSDSIGGKGNTRDVDPPRNDIAAQTAGTHTVKIEVVEETITTTPCFDKARGYSCGEGTLTEESVTTQKGKEGDYAYGELAYSQFINADSITVTFDGVEYECPRVADPKANSYGAPWNDSTQAYDWSEYPFAVVSDANGSSLATETAGTYSIKIEAAESSVTTTSCFEKAVKSVVGGGVVAHMTETHDSSTGCNTYTLDITDDDVRQIVESGSKLKIIDESNCVYYPVNIWARDATSAVRANQPTARVTIILQEPAGTPLMLETMTTTMTPRYLTKTVCNSTNRNE